MATSTVNSNLHSHTPTYSRALPRAGFWTKLAFAAGILLPAALLPTAQASANAAAELDVLRVDVPLDRAAFKNGELKISSLIADNTYIDVEEFNLRAIELEASSSRNGEVRLKVGRYVTPPVPLPGPNNEGLLRIEAPHKSNKSWRLLIDDRIHITSLTAVLEPRDDNTAYYESRYESRGYTLGRDDNYRSFSSSRHDSWPYSWLSNNYDYNRRSAHWFWLNDSRNRFGYNPGYGHSHRHTARCYDRFGRHMSFNSSNNNRSRFRDSQRSRDYYRSRDRLQAEQRLRDRTVRNRVIGPQRPATARPERQERDQRPARPQRNPNREPVMRAPNTPRVAPNQNDALRNQAAQAQMQQRMQQAQARRQQQIQRQQREHQQRRSQQERANATDRRTDRRTSSRSDRSTRSRAANSERAQRYNRNQSKR